MWRLGRGGKKKAKQGQNEEESPSPSREKEEEVSTEPVSELPKPTSSPVSPIKSSYAVPAQASSIFSGLHLTSTTAGNEAPDSSCLKETSNEEAVESEVSSFSFLTAPEVEPEVEPEVMEQPADDSGGFSFLKEPPLDPQEQSQPNSSMANEDKVDSTECTVLPVVDSEMNVQKKMGHRLTPSTGEKKKKRKAIRPGQSAANTSESTVSQQLPRAIPSLTVKDNEESTVGSAPNIDKQSDLVFSNEKEEVEVLSAVTDPVMNTDSGDCREEPPNRESNTRDCIENLESSTVNDKESNTVSDKGNLGLNTVSDRECMENGESSIVNAGDCRKDPANTELKGNYEVSFSHEESLAGLLQSYSNGLSKFRNNLDAVERSHQDRILQQIGLVQKQVDRWSGDRLLMEKEAKALAEEDYELAEQLNKQLEATGLKAEQDIMSAGLEVIKGWIQEYAKEKESEVQFQSEMLSRLGLLREEHSVVLEDLRREHTSLLAKEKMQLQSLENEVEREAGHVALDCSHLEKREQLLEEEKSRRAINFIANKEQLATELADIESEIVTLEAKLKLLRDRKVDIVARIVAEEEAIESVEQELADERLQLKAERETFQERQNKLLVQQKAVEQRRTAVDAMEKSQEEERHSLETLVARAAAVWGEMQGIEAVQSQRSHQVQQLDSLIEKGKKLLLPSIELTQAQQTVEVKKKLVDEQTTAILAGQTKLGEQRKKVRDLQAQLLQIQESKKAAVTGRQFKEASRLASESKTMNLLVEKQQELLAEAEQNMVASSQKLAQLSEDMSKAREELSQLESKEDEGHIQELSQASTSLSELVESFEENIWVGLVSNWKQLYTLLIKSLCSKHGIEEKPSAVNPPVTECSESHVDTVPAGQHAQVSRSDTNIEPDQKAVRIAMLEAEIEKACQEEDYDRAAELEEELQSLKNS